MQAAARAGFELGPGVVQQDLQLLLPVLIGKEDVVPSIAAMGPWPDIESVTSGRAGALSASPPRRSTAGLVQDAPWKGAFALVLRRMRWVS